MNFASAVRIVVIAFGAVGFVTALFFYERLREANARVAPQRFLVMLFVGIMIYGASAFAPIPWSFVCEIVGFALMLPWLFVTLRRRA